MRGWRLTAVALAVTVATVLVTLWGGAPEAQRPGSMQERGGCPYNYAPVCGTDGQTHANRCIAASHRAGMAYDGACRPGVAITCQRGGQTACGRDGRTYASRCAALSAGVEVLHDRACLRSEQSADTRRCGGRNGVRCPEGQRCDLSSAEPRRLDAMGVCVPRQ